MVGVLHSDTETEIDLVAYKDGWMVLLAANVNLSSLPFLCVHLLDNGRLRCLRLSTFGLDKGFKHDDWEQGSRVQSPPEQALSAALLHSTVSTLSLDGCWGRSKDVSVVDDYDEGPIYLATALRFKMCSSLCSLTCL
mgnify:FL=1